MPDEFWFSGTPGTEVIVRPVAGLGAAKLATVSLLVMATPEVSGVVAGPLLLGLCSASLHCVPEVDVLTAVSVGFGLLLVPHIIWAAVTRHPRLDIVGAGLGEPGQQDFSVKVGSLRAWPSPLGIVGTF